jgi:hypothetical protein
VQRILRITNEKLFFGKWMFNEQIMVFSPPSTIEDFLKYTGRADYVQNGKIRFSKNGRTYTKPG